MTAMLSDLLFRVRALVRRGAVERELDEELRDHLEHETRKYVEAGLLPDDAARRARVAMGGVEGIKEQCRDARGTRPLEEFLTDLRFGLRLLTRSPGFAFAAIAMLGLGVGSATAIFSIIHSVLLRPLPYPDSSRLVTLSEVDESGRRLRVSLPAFRDWEAGAKSFDAIAALRGRGGTIVTSRQSRRGYTVRFHGDVLRAFGTAIAHGRAFTSDETRTEAPVAVVPHGFAKSVWGEPERAVGEAVEFAGVGFTVVGVLEPASDERTDLFVPAAAFGPDASTRVDHDWQVIARLRPGIALAAARGEMQAIAGREKPGRAITTNAVTASAAAAGVEGDSRRGIERRRAAASERVDVAAAVTPPSVDVSSLLDDTVRAARPALLLLLAAGGLLILIACANVANLLLARGVGRRREIAVRQMLGAGRGRVVRQLIVENLPLALLSALAGIALAQWSFSGLLAMVPFSIPRRAEIAMDGSARMFGLLVSLVAGLLFALAPALQTPALQLTTQLNNAGRAASGRDGAVRQALVAGQFALALAVLTCAGLLTKSVVRMAHVETGFDYSRALVAETALPETSYASDIELNAFWRGALARVAALPGVEAVGVAQSAPFEGRYPNGTFEFLDEPGGSGRRGDAWYGVATAGFFPALKIPLLLGRLFDDRDSHAAARVPSDAAAHAGAQAAPHAAPYAAVINQLAADKFWPGQNPIGHRVRRLGKDLDADDAAPLTIVGVVGNMRHRSLADEPVPEIYVDFFQRPSRARDADLVIRSSNPAAPTAAVRGEFETLDRALPVRFHTLDSSYRESLAQPRFQALLIGFFAVCALLLSAAGLYSSMAYAVSQRTREIGIRLALGGAPRTVRRDVLRAAMRIAVVGGVAGAALGTLGGQLIANQLFGVQAGDPEVFVAAGAVLTMTALLAAYVPARRASQTNPIEALRYD
jgi:predicted permease